MDNSNQNSPRHAGRRKGPWSQAEIEKLKRKYARTPDHVLARELNRSVESVRRIAKSVFKSSVVQIGPWTPSEIIQLKDYWGASEIDKIALVLHRSAEDIERKVRELRGELHSGPWTADDIQRLKRYYGTRENSDLIVILGRTEAEIEAKATEFCLAKDKSFTRRSRGNSSRVRMPRWTAQDIELLTELYPDTPNLDIAHKLGRTLKSVVSKAHDLGLKKSSKRLRDMGRENVALRYRPEDDDQPPETGQLDTSDEPEQGSQPKRREDEDEGGQEMSSEA